MTEEELSDMEATLKILAVGTRVMREVAENKQTIKERYGISTTALQRMGETASEAMLTMSSKSSDMPGMKDLAALWVMGLLVGIEYGREVRDD